MPKIGIIPFILQEVNGYYGAKRARKKEEMDRIATQLGFALKTMEIQKEDAQRILAEARTEAVRSGIARAEEKFPLEKERLATGIEGKRFNIAKGQEELTLKRLDKESLGKYREGRLRLQGEAQERKRQAGTEKQPEEGGTEWTEEKAKDLGVSPEFLATPEGRKWAIKAEHLISTYSRLKGELREAMSQHDTLEGERGFLSSLWPSEEDMAKRKTQTELQGQIRGIKDSVRYIEQSLSKMGIPVGVLGPPKKTSLLLPDFQDVLKRKLTTLA